MSDFVLWPYFKCLVNLFWFLSYNIIYLFFNGFALSTLTKHPHFNDDSYHDKWGKMLENGFWKGLKKIQNFKLSISCELIDIFEYLFVYIVKKLKFFIRVGGKHWKYARKSVFLNTPHWRNLKSDILEMVPFSSYRE